MVVEPDSVSKREDGGSSSSRRGKASGLGGASRDLVARILLIVGVLAIGGGIGAVITWYSIENNVVATVNGTPITSSEFNHRLQVVAGNQVLKQLITEDMTMQFAQSQSAAPTDDQIASKLAKAQAQTDFAKKLAASHQTIDDIKQQLLIHQAQAGPLELGVTASDSDAQAFYNANINPKNPRARYYRPATVQIAAIVTTSQEKATAALNALASGYSFGAVAQAYTQLSGTQQGGLLPPFEKGHIDGAKFPGLENLIFGLNVGQQTPITKIGNAYWIIRCVGKAPETTVPFSQVADECREGALLTKGLQANGQKVQQAQQAFQKSVVVKTNWPGYAQVLNGGTQTQ